MYKKINQIATQAQDASLRTWIKWTNFATREDGLETIEVVAMGAAGAVLIGLILTVFQSNGKSLGETIFQGILSWASKIGGGN
jgi:hypothetical protein